MDFFIFVVNNKTTETQMKLKHFSVVWESYLKVPSVWHIVKMGSLCTIIMYLHLVHHCRVPPVEVRLLLGKLVVVILLPFLYPFPGWVVKPTGLCHITPKFQSIHPLIKIWLQLITVYITQHRSWLQYRPRSWWIISIIWNTQLFGGFLVPSGRTFPSCHT